jgi:phosphatidylglycerol:prolipoprotein diacylglycerol transferase
MVDFLSWVSLIRALTRTRSFRSLRPMLVRGELAFPDIDPVAFSIGPFEARWYALAYVAGLILGFWYMKRLVGNSALWGENRPAATPRQIDDLFLWATLGVVLGGRLGYVLFYDPAYFAAHPVDIVKMWQGGMSFHGGFFGVILACWAFAGWQGLRLDQILDLAAASVPFGLGFGRLANFINGELYGRVSDVPWAVVFPEGGPLPRHPSQLYEAFLEGALLFLLIRMATHRFHVLIHPGRAAGIFALSYGLVRIFVEFFREPDAHIGFDAGFLTRGMMLSLPMILIGLWLLMRSRRA